MMNHRKVDSEGNVPFSWEDKPGVSRMNPEDSKGHELSEQKVMIPLPPCPSKPFPSRSGSTKGVIGWWQEMDPFVVAYKECTKRSKKKRLMMMNVKSKFVFSCKDSCDVIDDNLLPNLPPLPKERIRT